MSEKIICDKSDLVAIADTVRAKNGTSETFSVPELSAAAVQAIQTGGGSQDAVLYTEQVLTEEQKTQARENIGAQAVINGVAGQIVGFNANGKPVAQKAPSGDTVLFVKQNLTGAQKTQARKNIEAVKNWDELDGKPFYESITRGREIVAETTVTVDPERNDIMFDPALFTGEETGLYIEFDGISYECARNEFSGFGVFGNMAAVEGEDTGEPFALAVAPSMGMVSMLLMNPDAEPHTVRIEELHIELKKIEGKFIDSEWLAKYKIATEQFVKPDTAITFSGVNVVIAHELGLAITNVIMESCVVNWDGTIYDCPVIQVEPGYAFVGYDQMTGGLSGEYPFAFVIVGDSMLVTQTGGSDGSTHVFSVVMTFKAPNTLPAGFLPIATQEMQGAMSPADKAKLDQLKNATTSADGLMSAADKTKLDSLKTYSNATASAAGLMSASDKSKLDSLKTYSNATTTAAGLMSAADKTKLDSLSTSGGGKIDTTLTVSGSAADAKVVGDRFTSVEEGLESTAVVTSLAFPGSLKWDGVIGDRAYVSMGTNDDFGTPMLQAFVHVSDEVPTIIEPFGIVSMSMILGLGEAMEVPLIDMGGGAYVADEGVVITLTDNYDLDGLIFPKKGVYFMAATMLPNGLDISFMYVSALKIIGYSFAESGGGGDASKYFEKIGGGGVSGGESVGETLTWDGTVGERPHVEMRVDMSTGAYVEYQWVYVATNTPTYEELEGITIPYQILDNGELVDKTGIAGTPDEITGLLALPNSTMVVYSDNHTAEVIPGTTVVFPKAGIYFADISLTNSEGSQQARTTSLTIPGYNFTLPVFATESREIIKYEHLPDALQFGGVMKPNDTLKWDGNTAGLYGAKYSGSGPQPLWKVSDAMPTEEMIKAASIVVTRPDGSTDTLKASDHPDMVYVTDDAAIFADGVIIVVYTAPFVTGDMEFEETGTYFIKVETATTTELTIPGSNAFGTMEYKHIDHKYLPEALQFGEITETIPGGIIAWDGDMVGREYDGGDGMYIVKVSDATPTIDDFANGAYLRTKNRNTGETSE